MTQADVERFADQIVFDMDDSGSSCTKIEVDPKTGKPRAVIAIGKALYEEVLEAYKNGTDAANDGWLQMRIASDICHEVAHAIMGLTHGAGVEAYFGDSLVAEEGYEWEKRAFGGVFRPEWPACKVPRYYVDSTPAAVKGMIVLGDWPCRSLVKAYQSRGWPIGVRGEVPKVHIVWHTPIAYFVNLLQGSWWATEFASRGPSALHPPKITGCRYVTRDGPPVSSVVYYTTEDEEHLADTVPRGYEANWRGLVVPMEGPGDGL
ncbi:hypothetical protein LTR65_005443 [Meristemomyces frigidus]